jgi:hypothetical protein
MDKKHKTYLLKTGHGYGQDLDSINVVETRLFCSVSMFKILQISVFTYTRFAGYYNEKVPPAFLHGGTDDSLL